LLGLIDTPCFQRKNSEPWVNDKHPKRNILPKLDFYPNHKKIRLGYFSPDFREHPVSDLIVELLEIHNRNKFEIHAFSCGRDTQDKMNLRIKAAVDHFHDVHMKSDQDIALLARSLEIDIAIDLGGFTQGSRIGVFAMSAAPIQTCYLGYAGTMGADYMDYLICDRVVIPEDKQNYYLENLVYMPNSYMVNDSQIKPSDKKFSKSNLNLPAKGFVFCCFNNAYKITPETFAGWMRILKAVSGSVLWLPKSNKTAIQNLKHEAVKYGIDESRLIFASRLELKEDHLKRIQSADLFLDTLPFNAHTTASDALRVGLPVLTCIGESFTSRVAASLLTAVNLPELITTSQEEYEALAIELATNPKKYRAIKDKLINNLSEATLYDTPLFTKHIESAYKTMYERNHDGLEPNNIYVEQ
jgi:protein O-GlcNAc transferase